jgi:hypothetical protein
LPRLDPRQVLRIAVIVKVAGLTLARASVDQFG